MCGGSCRDLRSSGKPGSLELSKHIRHRLESLCNLGELRLDKLVVEAVGAGMRNAGARRVSLKDVSDSLSDLRDRILLPRRKDLWVRNLQSLQDLIRQIVL